MKIKLLSILMAIAVALAFTSCDSKKSRSHDKDSDKSKSEQVDEEDEDENEAKFEAVHPTGDIEKDAEALTKCTIAYFKKINTAEDIHTVQKDYTKIPQEFQEFYKDKGKSNEFNVAYYKMMQDPKYAKDIKEGQEKIQKFIDEAINANKKK